MKVILIRHGQTQGNLEGRYVGRTDEPLTDEFADKLNDAIQDIIADRLKLTASQIVTGNPAVPEPAEGEFPILDGGELGMVLREVTDVYVSPLKRCRETADIIFSYAVERHGMHSVPGLRECDFGNFEYKRFDELGDDPDYVRFSESGQISTFPGGESVTSFKDRCVDTFSNIVQNKFYEYARMNVAQEPVLAFVIHGGTIMSIMEACAEPSRPYFSWQVANCNGFYADVSIDRLKRPTVTLTGYREVEIIKKDQ